MAAPPSSGPQRSFLILATLALVVVFLYYAQKVLIPLALAILLTFVLLPAVNWLQRRGLRRTPAVLLAVVLAFSLLGAAGWLLALEVRSLAAEIEKPAHKENIINKIASLEGTGGGVMDKLKVMWQDISSEFHKLAAGQEAEERPPQRVQIDTPSFAWLPNILGPLVEFLATALLVIMLVIFMLIRREDLRNRLLRVVGTGRLTLTTRALDEAAQRISRFLVMQLIINLGFGTLLGIGLFLIHVPYAFLWGFLAAVLRFVPYVGTWIAMVLPLAISIALSEGWAQPLLLVALFLSLELFTANVIEPLLFSHSTGVSPVALLIAVVFWTWLWGPIGLVLATPLTTCLVVLGKYVPQIEFFDVLLGDEAVLETEVSYYQRLLARDPDEAALLVEEHLKTQPLETVYDEMLVPALVLARRDRQRGELAPEDGDFIVQVTRDILEDLVLPQQQIKQIATAAAPLPGADDHPAPAKALVLAYPARDETDALALEMFRQLLEPAGCRVEIGSVALLASEMMAQVREQQPGAVCIASLPPGGLTHARYLCKRLRSQFPELKILVGLWGQTADVAQAKERLRSAGADQVATRLLDSRAQVIPLVQVAAAPPQPKKPEPEPVRSR
ncbi:MAG TPA: AI-2E family transporter [Gemmataceae bacterium]|nr:AI-2E family transporter [Gemmataceae bacterium]